MLEGMEPLRARHVALTVRDLDRSTAWYRDVFDLAEIRNETSDHRRAVVLSSPDGQVQIGLVQHLPTSDEPFDPTTTGLDHMAWAVPSLEELERWQQRFRERDVVHSPLVDLGHVAIINFKDPDGIALALFWDRA